MKKLFVTLMACVLLSGCVVGALNPFFTDDLVVQQAQLSGSWYFTENGEANDDSPIVLSEGKMTVYEDQGMPADAKVTFFQVDGVLFVDIFAEEGWLKQNLVKDQTPVHLLSRVRVTGADQMSFNALDYEWLAKEVEAGTIVLPHQKVADRDIMFTATSVQWVDFLRQYKDNPKAFPPDAEAPLIRKTSAK